MIHIAPIRNRLSDCDEFLSARVREPEEAGPDGEFRGPSEQRGLAETQPPPPRALPGGEPLCRVPGVQAVCCGLPPPATGIYWELNA